MKGGSPNSEARIPRALIADDDPAVRECLGRVLHHFGFAVTEVSNGRDALSEADAGAFALAVIDLAMPEMDGIEAIQALHRDHPEIGIIAISGAFNGQFLTVARYLGARGTLSKPVTVERLRAAVAAILGGVPAA